MKEEEIVDDIADELGDESNRQRISLSSFAIRVRSFVLRITHNRLGPIRLAPHRGPGGGHPHPARASESASHALKVRIAL